MQTTDRRRGDVRFDRNRLSGLKDQQTMSEPGMPSNGAGRRESQAPRDSGASGVARSVRLACRQRVGLRGALAAELLVLALILASPGATSAADDDWPTYHHSADRSGNVAVGSTFSDVQSTWTTAGLDGSVYAEPLYVGGHVLVATENNTVYSIDASSGEPIWQTHLADPVPAGPLPCGNIRPTVGITGTPVVDPAAGVLYAAAMVQPTHYELFAVDLGSGSAIWHRSLDTQGLDPPSAGQRGALALEQGQVYVPFGGRLGDCGSYRGQVIAASATDPNAPVFAYTTPARRAGMWAPGGVAIGPDGTLYVATGNGDASGPEGRTEAVLALSPSLEEADAWQPTDWQALDRSDTDVGSVPPALLLDQGLIFQTGKNGQGYLLKIGGLGSVGGEAYSATVPAGCGGVFGATAYASPLVYIPCGGKVVALRVSNNPPSFSLAWQGPGEGGGTVGAPIVAAGAVWDVDPSGRLLALDAGSGQQRWAGDLPGQAAKFAGLAYGGGQVYVATPEGVAAFQLVGLTSGG
jgi:outer membrane protein assembly factor BamB